MKSFYRLLMVFVVMVVTSSWVSAQEKPQAKTEPEHKLVEFHMALLKHGPKWTAAENTETKRLHQEHVNYVVSLLDSGKAVLAGPFNDGGEIEVDSQWRSIRGWCPMVFCRSGYLITVIFVIG